MDAYPPRLERVLNTDFDDADMPLSKTAPTCQKVGLVNLMSGERKRLDSSCKIEF
jgi:hypothetical protein